MSRFWENVISIPLWLIIAPTVPLVLTHWSMVKECSDVKKLKRATYKELKQKMLSAEWEFNGSYPNSLFPKSYPYENYFHASIFRFGDVGYLMTPYGLLMANILQRRIRKSLPSYYTNRKLYIK